MNARERGVGEAAEEEGALSGGGGADVCKHKHVCVCVPFLHPYHTNTHPADARVDGRRAGRVLLPLLPHHEAHRLDGLGEAALLF